MGASKSDKIGGMLNLRRKGENESRSDRIGKTLGLIPEDAEEGGASPVKVLVLGIAVLSALAALWLFYTSTDSSIINDVPNAYAVALISLAGVILLLSFRYR